ncbi:hypothetical protein KEU06_09295 [Pseudaminobacter sp. 19-2017]|uniref:Uncharacterized protein n=1 Tax=Pseudaminobacter soli (ex Zhang et al. 2022) TaxID=2831468 RepID=A0A942I2R5_9HYPH|nr:hypothetical protein [Pseudaminobacter soli]MBS3648799.1 hypothetical protein [Pseudaminobacter soli]
MGSYTLLEKNGLMVDLDEAKKDFTLAIVAEEPAMLKVSTHYHHHVEIIDPMLSPEDLIQIGMRLIKVAAGRMSPEAIKEAAGEFEKILAVKE